METRLETVKIPQSIRFDNPRLTTSLIQKWRTARSWIVANPFAAARYHGNRAHFNRRKAAKALRKRGIVLEFPPCENLAKR